MSGPKGYNAVLAERLRRERELAARRRTWLQIVEQLTATDARCRATDLEVDVWRELAAVGYDRSRLQRPSDADLDGVADLERGRAAVSRRLEEAATARAAARAQVALDGLRAALDTNGELVVTALAPVAAAAPTPSAVKAPVELLSGLLGSTGERQAQLTAELERLLDSDRAAGRQDWLEYAARVADGARAERDRHDRAALRDEFVAIIARVSGPAAETLIARIDGAPDRASLEALRPTVLAAVRAAELDAERAFVIAQAIEVWRELGYEPGPEFSEVALSGDAALLPHRDWTAHALQVRFDEDGLGLATNVVATSATDPLRDKEIEDDHCADIAAFTESLAGRGVDASLVRRVAAGALPMQHLDAETVTARRRRRAAVRRTGG